MGDSSFFAGFRVVAGTATRWTTPGDAPIRSAPTRQTMSR